MKFYEKYKKQILFIGGALVVFFIIAIIANGDALNITYNK